MNRVLQFAIFISIFLPLYLGLNMYVLWRLENLFDIGLPIMLILLGLLTVSMPVMSFLENSFPHPITRWLYIISSLWLGVAFLFLLTLTAYDVITSYMQLPGLIVPLIVGALTAYSIWNAHALRIKEIHVSLGIGKKIAHITDLHIGTIRNEKFIKRVVALIKKARPDIVVITGDLIDATAPLHKGMFDTLNTLTMPIYFVTGNHETYQKDALSLIEHTKIKVLYDKVVHGKFDIAGYGYGHDISKIRFKKKTILLYHDPTQWKMIKNTGAALTLCGHTHDGQIFPFNFIVKLFIRKVHGLYEDDGQYVYVNPGTGTWGPYMRLGSKNEVTLIHT